MACKALYVFNEGIHHDEMHDHMGLNRLHVGVALKKTPAYWCDKIIWERLLE